MEYYTIRKVLLHTALILPFLASLARARGRSCWSNDLTYYLHQEFGNNELQLVPAARPPVPGSLAGFGQEVVYEFNMTESADPLSRPLGYVRGTALAVNNTAAATIFVVNNVIHYDNGVINGTISQQGEAIFTNAAWEFAIVGGTGAFRNVHGYNVGKITSVNRDASGTLIVSYYEARLFRCRC